MHVTSTCGLRTRIKGVPGRLTTEQRPPKQRVEQGTSENESEALLFAQPSVVPLRTGPVWAWRVLGTTWEAGVLPATPPRVELRAAQRVRSREGLDAHWPGSRLRVCALSHDEVGSGGTDPWVHSWSF